MPLTTSLKHLTLRMLPDSLLQPLRKAHYGRESSPSLRTNRRCA